MRADDLAVIGGAHGIAARLDDLAGAARHLRRAGLDLGLVAAVASEGMRNPGVMATAPLSPVTWAALEEALVRLAHPGALPLDAAGLTGLGATLEASVLAYEQVEHAATAAFEGTADTVGVTLGITVGVAAPAVLLAGTATLATPQGQQAFVAAARLGATPAGRYAGRTARRAVDASVAENPWAVSYLAAGADGIVLGLRCVYGAPADPVLSAAARSAGVPYPPRDARDATAILAALVAAAPGPMLEDGPLRARRDAAGRPQAPTRERVVPPRTVGDLVDGGRRGVLDDGIVVPVGPGRGESRDRGTSTVRVQRVDRDGRTAWILHYPPTKEFDPRPGTNPYDMTANTAARGRGSTAVMDAAHAALVAAQRRADAQDRARGIRSDHRNDPVMVVGHSQGGIHAARSAEHSSFRGVNITHVVTYGSPVDDIDVPPHVSLLSLETDRDIVPRLDGRAPVDAPHRVTVRRTAPDSDDTVIGLHGSAAQRETARQVDARITGGDRTLAEWRRGASDFLDGESSETTDVWLERDPVAGSAG